MPSTPNKDHKNARKHTHPTNNMDATKPPSLNWEIMVFTFSVLFLNKMRGFDELTINSKLINVYDVLNI